MFYPSAFPENKLKTGTRVSLDMTTLTIVLILLREVDPIAYKMSLEDPGGASFLGIDGLGEQVQELCNSSEVCLPRRLTTQTTHTQPHLAQDLATAICSQSCCT